MEDPYKYYYQPAIHSKKRAIYYKVHPQFEVIGEPFIKFEAISIFEDGIEINNPRSVSLVIWKEHAEWCPRKEITKKLWDYQLLMAYGFINTEG